MNKPKRFNWMQRRFGEYYLGLVLYLSLIGAVLMVIYESNK